MNIITLNMIICDNNNYIIRFNFNLFTFAWKYPIIFGGII